MSNRNSDFVMIGDRRLSVVCVEMALYKLYAGRGIRWELSVCDGGIMITVSFSTQSQNTAEPIWNATKSEIEGLAIRFHKEDMDSIS